MRTVNELFLGTVKLGMPEYGFSSSVSEKSFDPIQFLRAAAYLGITRLDTSPRYGNSEEIIGRYIQESHSIPFVASKIDNLEANNPGTPQIMEQSVRNSLLKFHLPALDICYLHQNEIAVISDPFVHRGLSLLKEKGLIRQAGASVYSQEECSYAVDSGVFDVIQVPVNVFDLGFYNNFIYQNSTPIKFVARSLLLQGILVNRSKIKEHIKQSVAVLEYLQKLDEIARRGSMSILEMALAFVYGLEGIKYYVIGTTSLENLKHNIQCMKVELPQHIVDELKALAAAEKEWTNPRNWNKDGQT